MRVETHSRATDGSADFTETSSRWHLHRQGHIQTASETLTLTKWQDLILSLRCCDFLRLLLKSFTSDEQQSRLCRWCVCVKMCARGGECALVCVCVIEERASPEEVRGSQTWSWRDLKDAATSPLYLCRLLLCLLPQECTSPGCPHHS